MTDLDQQVFHIKVIKYRDLSVIRLNKHASVILIFSISCFSVELNKRVVMYIDILV